jgi:HAMP domain-containing protein
MRYLFSRLRIGEKIGLGFGLVGAIFVAVIWQYHHTLDHVLAEYGELQQVHEAKSAHAQGIASHLLAAGQAKEAFLRTRELRLADAVQRQLDASVEATRQLARIDAEGATTAAAIDRLVTGYRQAFLQTFDAWRLQGLDQDSGLQGIFRRTAHRLGELAGQYSVSGLYIQLLQMRRSEKDLLLRREAMYAEQVRQLATHLHDRVAASTLPPEVKTQLQEELGRYRQSFDALVRDTLADGQPAGGKGPFRDAAHRMEALLETHYVPDMEVHVLELRRREKDFLLRSDPRYVGMVRDELGRLGRDVRESQLAASAQTQLFDMFADYERDFLALVEQHDRIARFEDEMRRAAAAVDEIVTATLVRANAMSTRMTAEIHATTARDSHILLWIVALASGLGVLFAFLITRRITRPILRMAGFLDQLALEDSTERIPTLAGSRDEIDAMAVSVNQMADNRAHLLAWWKSSVAELEAARDRAGRPAPG